MKISVIVPTRGDGKYLNDCLDSLDAQTFANIERIVIEDSRSDPEGPAALRNRGIAKALGDYLLFLDDDDFLSPDALEAAAKKAEESQGALVRLAKRTTWFGYATVMADADTESSAYDRTDGSCTGLLIPAKLLGRDRLASGENDGTIAKEDEGQVRGGDAGSESFDESLRYSSGLPALAGLLKLAELVMADGGTYFSRFHNDPIRFPSLSQEKSGDRYEQTGRAYLSALEKASEGDLGEGQGNRGRAREYVVRVICGETRATLLDSKGGLSRLKDSDLEHISRALRAIDPAEMKKTLDAEDAQGPKARAKSGRRDMKLLMLFREGKFGAVRRRAGFARKLGKKKGLFGSALQWKFNIAKLLFSRLSVKKELTLFESFFGKAYGDSPKAIYECMSEKCPGRRYVWAIDNRDARIPGRHREVKPMSLKYFYYVFRCGAWINNMRQPDWYVKKEGVIFLETWHGTPLKKLVFDMDEVHGASPDYKAVFYGQSRAWDWLISANPYSTEVFSGAFLFPKEKIIEEGYPRNDLLLADDREERANRIRRALGIPEGRKVALYAPTWRDDSFYEGGRYRFDLPLDVEVMRQLKDEYVFLLRTHYYIADSLKLSAEDGEFIKDVSGFNDITELYLIADVLITDYSSVFFDYAILGRPIIFYVYDLEHYRDTLRGFYFDMEKECPGPMLTDSARVGEALRDLEGIKRQYADRYEAFRKKFCGLDDGHAAERVVRKVFGA